MPTAKQSLFNQPTYCHQKRQKTDRFSKLKKTKLTPVCSFSILAPGRDIAKIRNARKKSISTNGPRNCGFRMHRMRFVSLLVHFMNMHLAAVAFVATHVDLVASFFYCNFNWFFIVVDREYEILLCWVYGSGSSLYANFAIKTSPNAL